MAPSDMEESPKSLRNPFVYVSDQQWYVSYFETAMTCDMRSGQAKDWVSCMVHYLRDCAGLSWCDIGYKITSEHCKTNTTVEMVYADPDSVEDDNDVLISSPIT